MEVRLVDVPHLCPSCGARYWVTGGEVSDALFALRKALYSIEDEVGNVYESFGDPLCPQCGAILIDEEVWSILGGGYGVEPQD
ncbi:hypothetical protein MN1_780 [Thermus phage MN1]|nr:hypothetical protein MN1_780 [Thermus phage MN1]